MPFSATCCAGLIPSLRHPSTWRVDLAGLRVPPLPAPAGRFGQGEIVYHVFLDPDRDEEPRPPLMRFWVAFWLA